MCCATTIEYARDGTALPVATSISKSLIDEINVIAKARRQRQSPLIGERFPYCRANSKGRLDASGVKPPANGRYLIIGTAPMLMLQRQSALARFPRAR